MPIGATLYRAQAADRAHPVANILLYFRVRVKNCAGIVKFILDIDVKQIKMLKNAAKRLSFIHTPFSLNRNDRLTEGEEEGRVLKRVKYR